MNSYFFENIPTLKENWDEVSSMFTDVAVKAKTTLLYQGDIANNIYFVSSGCLRLWFNDDGKDITFQFFFENQAVSSFESFFNEEPSLFNIETVEDSYLTIIRKDDYDNLIKMLPAINEYTSKVLIDRLSNYTQLFLSRIKNSPEERYNELCSLDSRILERVPHHYIASYLGITSVSLSRIRNRKK